MKILKTSLNMIITGNPGTGKSTIARSIAKYLYAFGVLPRDNFVEKNGLEMKGMYVGHTAPVVKEAIADAMGGCLFIDEAYALSASEGNDPFSGEAVRTLLTEVENNRTNLLVILAGYEDKMVTNKDSLMAADPGLPRRFGTRLHLVNYTPLEVARIAQLVANKKFSLTFEPGLLEALADHIELAHGRINRAGTTDIAQQNGGLAVNLTEVAFRRLAKRVVEDGIPIGDPTTSMLVPSDFLIGQELVPLEEEGQPAIEEPATTWYPEGVTDIDGLLDYLQIPQYKEVFSDEEVHIKHIPWISQEALKDMGVKTGPRCTIKEFQATLSGGLATLDSLQAKIADLQQQIL